MHLGLNVGGYAPLVMYIGAMIAFLLSVLWKPHIGLYYLIPLLPMQTARYWLHAYPFGEKLVDVLLLGVLIGLFLRSERPVFISSPINTVLIVFGVLLYLSLWQGALYLGGSLPLSIADPRFSDWKNYEEMMFLFFIGAAAIRTPTQMKIVLGLMCLSILVVNRNYYSTVGTHDHSYYSDDFRDAGPLGYAGENGMGAFQAQLAVFLFGLASFAKKKRTLKVGLWALAYTCLYCLLFTFSRGGYVGFIVGLVVLGVLKERKLLILLTVILLGAGTFLPNAVVQRVLMTYQEGQVDPSAEERIDLWQDAAQVIREDPVFGTGFDTYKFMGRIAGFGDTHNYYVKMLLEMGVVGFLIFAWTLRSAVKMTWDLFRNAKEPFLSAFGCALFSMLACALVVNLFGDRWSFLQVNGFLWVLLGLAARGLFLTRQRQEVPEMAQQELPLTGSTVPRLLTHE